MKNKRFIAKCLTLAMIFALMIPTPVSAASSKGKLLKSVTYYDYNTSRNRYEKSSMTSFTYNKKNYPKEIREVQYGEHILGVPTTAKMQVNTTKYKFKGKTPKSMKLKDTAGRLVGTYKYKKGRVVSGVYKEEYDSYDEDNGNFSKSGGNFSVKYNKKGLATSYVYNSASSYKDTTYSGNSNYSATTTFTVTQTKKGIPKRIVASRVWTSSYADTDGDSGSESSKAPTVSYTKFNNKGLAIEGGTIDSATGAEKKTYTIAYKTKKGRVTQATVTRIYSDGTSQIDGMYKFKYTKKKASNSRYLKMINREINEATGYFSWY